MHAIVFDIDGTLLQSAAADDRIYRESVAAVLGPVRFRECLSDYDFVTDGGILVQILEDNSIEPVSGTIDSIKNEFLNRVTAHIEAKGPFREIPGATDFVRRLIQSPKHRIGIATGGWRSTARLKLETAGFDIADVPLATSDDAVERTKIMEIALTNLNRRFDTVTYFGDGEWDREACRTLGWSFRAVGPALGGIRSFHGEGVE